MVLSVITVTSKEFSRTIIKLYVCEKKVAEDKEITNVGGLERKKCERPKKLKKSIVHFCQNSI